MRLYRKYTGRPLFQNAKTLQNLPVEVQGCIVVSGKNGKKRGRGRPRGKHSDPNYPKVTLYLSKETTIEVKRRLGDLDKSMSDLVQELLEEWLASNPDTSE